LKIILIFIFKIILFLKGFQTVLIVECESEKFCYFPFFYFIFYILYFLFILSFFVKKKPTFFVFCIFEFVFCILYCLFCIFYFVLFIFYFLLH